MLATLAVLLILFWIGGLVFHFLGAFIHIALVLGLALLVAHFIRPRATA